MGIIECSPVLCKAMENLFRAIEIWLALPYYNYEKVGEEIMDKEQQHQEDLQRIRGLSSDRR